MDRRSFLKNVGLGGAAAGTLALVGCGRIPNLRRTIDTTPQRVGQVLTNPGVGESFEAFQTRLEGYYSFDNQINPETGANEGNIWKFLDLVKPMLNETLTPEDIVKLKYLIRDEVGSAYTQDETQGYRKYDASRIYQDRVFFGNIAGEVNILNERGALIDSRISTTMNIHSLDVLLAYTGYESNGEDTGFVIQDNNGMYCFLYYEQGRLKYAAPTSPGSTILGSTPNTGLEYAAYRDIPHYYLDDENKGLSQEELNLRRTTGTVGGSMPYSRRVLRDGLVDGYYTHIGDVTGRQESHGCIRLPALWAYIMFYDGNTGAPIHYLENQRLI